MVPHLQLQQKVYKVNSRITLFSRLRSYKLQRFNRCTGENTFSKYHVLPQRPMNKVEPNYKWDSSPFPVRSINTAGATSQCSNSAGHVDTSQDSRLTLRPSFVTGLPRKPQEEEEEKRDIKESIRFSLQRIAQERKRVGKEKGTFREKTLD